MAAFLEQASRQSGWLMAYAVGGVIVLIALFGFQDGKPRWQTLVMYAVVFPCHAVAGIAVGLLLALWAGGCHLMDKNHGTILWIVFVSILGVLVYREEHKLFERNVGIVEIAGKLVFTGLAHVPVALFLTVIAMSFLWLVFNRSEGKR